MGPSHDTTAPACRNCGTPAPSFYCPDCGQDTAAHPPSLWEFVHEFVGHYVAVEGRLWQTLRLLLLRPGRLTAEYLAGRKVRYVLPLRLYLTTSFLFFLVVKVAAPTLLEPGAGHMRHDGTAATQPLTAEQRARVLEDLGCASPEGDCGWLQRGVAGAVVRLGEAPQQAAREVQSRVLAMAPYAVFLLLPVFAGLVQLAYRSRRRVYGEHVVFALHLHAFGFLAMLALWALPPAAAEVLGWLLVVYGVVALRRVYGGRWWTTLARTLFLGVTYGALLFVVALTLSVYALVA